MTKNYFFSQIVLLSSNNLFAQDYFKQFHLKYLSTGPIHLEGERLKILIIPTGWNPRFFTMNSSEASPIVIGYYHAGDQPILIRDDDSLPIEFWKNTAFYLNAYQSFYMDKKARYKLEPYLKPYETYSRSKNYSTSVFPMQQYIWGKDYYSFIFEDANPELQHDTSFFIDVEIAGYYYNNPWKLTNSSNGWNQAEEFNYKINLNTTKNYFTI